MKISSKNLRNCSGLRHLPVELEHRKLGWKVLILKNDFGMSLGKEMWFKMAYTKKFLTTYLKRLKMHVIQMYEVNPFCVRGQENDFPS